MLLEGVGRRGRSTLKKIFVQGKILWKKYARQVALKNIPKIQCKGNNNEKNSCGSKKVRPPKGPSLIFFFNQKCQVNSYFLSLIYLFKNVKQCDALYVSGFLGVSRKQRLKTEDLENEDPP